MLRPRALPPEFDFELEGGLRAHLRPVRPLDSVRFERGYPKLSETSRRQRFFGQSSALSQTQLHFLTAIDHVRHVAWGALNADDLDEPGLGIGRYIALRDSTAVAEVALTVLDAYQHRGVGLLLHACLHRTAARHGFREFVYDVSEDNTRFLHHLKALGARQDGVDAHIVRLSLPVYARARQVPASSAAAARFGAVMRRLALLHPAASSTGQGAADGA